MNYDYEDYVTIQDRLEAGEPLSVEMMAEVFGPVVYELVDAARETHEEI